MNSTLEEFCEEILPWLDACTEPVEHRDYGKLQADVIYRRGNFQVERVTMAPNYQVQAHRHPNIDAYEFHIRGDLVFLVAESAERVNKFLDRVPAIKEHRLWGKSFRVQSTAWHGAKSGDAGCAFYSVQKWTGAVPVTAAGVDWEGPALC
jgi:hypothetical protein